MTEATRRPGGTFSLSSTADRMTMMTASKKIRAMASASGMVRIAPKKQIVAPIKQSPRPICSVGAGAASTLPPWRQSAMGSTSRK